jgi:hypothetical protein
VRVDAGGAPLPAVLRVRFAHATRAGLDRTAVLELAGDGSHAGRIEPLPAGRWIVTAEAEAWRLPSVEVMTPFTELRLGDRASAPPRP